jgi:DNA-binding transcriptional LysR family regulator
LLGELKDRKLDMALVSFKPRDSGIEARFVTRDELVLITSPKHAFAAKASVQLGDLAKESILLMDISRPSPWHDKVTDAFMRCNAPLNLTLENAPIETIKKMVAIGLGVSFVPLISVREEIRRGELSVVAVEGFRQERSVWLVRRKTVHSLAAKAFAQIAASYGQRLELLPQGAITPGAKVAEVAQRAVAVLKRRR